MVQYRQGDVWIEYLGEQLPPKTKMEKVEGPVVLAEGEVTGHAHRILQGAEMWRTKSNPDDRYLLVGDDGASVTHEEHSTIPLTKGVYRVWRQMEYQPHAVPQRVLD